MDLKLKGNEVLKKLDASSLKEEFKKASKNLFELKMKKSLGELKQTHLIKENRRYVARIKTIASEKDFNIG